MADTILQKDLVEKFRDLSPERRRKMIGWSLSQLMMTEGATDGEREIADGYLRAALTVDRMLLFKMIAEATGAHVTAGELAVAKEEATDAKTGFARLETAVLTLRTSLIQMGIIENSNRLPQTVKEWDEAIAKVVEVKSRRLADRERQLNRQQDALEKMRAEVLAEIEAAQKLLGNNSTTLNSAVGNHLDYADREITRLFQQEISRVVADVKDDAKILLLKKFASQLDQSGTRIAITKGTIAGMNFGLDQLISCEIGELIEGKGIYVGVWEPKNRQGVSLNKKYHVFAAPQDLTNSSNRHVAMTFLEAAREMGLKRNWCSHDGLTVPANAIENGYEAYLYGMLKDNTYRGQWFIPTLEILRGQNANGDPVEAGNLFDCREQGAFAQEKYTLMRGGNTNPYWYWSCTEDHHYPRQAYSARFIDGKVDSDAKNRQPLSCRPCRLEPAL